MSRASGLVLILTGLAAATYVSLKTDTNAVKTDFVQYTETHPAVPIAELLAVGAENGKTNGCTGSVGR